jgi:hypothetical protein
VAVAIRGQEIGEMGLIGQFAAVRTATVQAHTDMEVAVIPYATFVDFVGAMSYAQVGLIHVPAVCCFHRAQGCVMRGAVLRWRIVCST